MEIEILNWIQQLRTPLGDVLMPLITSLGNGGVIWILLTAALLLMPKTRKTGLALALALAVDVVLCNLLLKNLVARARPCDFNPAIQLLIARPRDFSFPSGHSAAAFAAVTALAIRGEKWLWRPALVLAVLLAFSRMYLYVHYPSDIMGGILVGVFSGLVGCRLFDSLAKRS